MSSRERIIATIRQNKPEATALPELPLFESEKDLTAKFKLMVETAGATVTELPSIDAVSDFIKDNFTGPIASSIIHSTITIDKTSATHLLEGTEVTVLKGEWGVAENGAIWLPEANMLHRALPFITQHLVLTLKKENIVANMHRAYKEIEAEGYGVFISGPSKTADIEQSLVIGAHGARSLMVVLLDT